MSVLAANNLEQVNRLVVEAFSAGAILRNNVFQKVYTIQDATRKDEKYQIVKLDNSVTETTDGGSYSQSNIVEIGGKTISQLIYKDAVNIGDFAERFDNYSKIVSTAKEKGMDYSYKMDQIGVAQWNNPTSTSGVYGFIVDGTSTKTSLISDTQPVGDTGATNDNYVNSAYSKSNLILARRQLVQMKRHNGNIAGYQPRMILCPTALIDQVYEDIKSPIGPTGDNNKNYLNSLNLEPIEWDLLSSTTKCFLLASKDLLATRYVIGYAPLMKMIRRQDTGCLEVQVEAMYACGVADYQGIVGIGT